jgi:O-antigen/teichoic acid export membrane protein
VDLSKILTGPEPPERTGADPAGEGATRVGAALEASVEGVAGSLAMTSSAGAPSLGGELLLQPTPAGPGGEGVATQVVSPATVRSGMLDAGPLALAGLAANGLNALVTVLVARLLSNRGYGSLAQLTGLFLVVSMPGSAVIVGVVRRITGWGDRAPAAAVRRWAVRLHARATLALVAFAVAMVLLRGQIDQFLSSPNSVGVAAMLIAGGIWVLLSFDRGLLQARREYRTLAVNLLVEGVGRVVGILCLVGAGFGVAGAACGVLLAELATALHARLAADRAWSGPGPGDETDDGVGRLGLRILRPLIRDLAGWRGTAKTREWLAKWWGEVRAPAPAIDGGADRWAIVTDLAVALPSLSLIALLQNVDVIVLARDNPHSSGVYAAISVVSKALVFGAVALGGYLLPEAAIHWHRGHHALRQLTVTIVLLGVPAVGLLAVAVVAPHELLTLVFSARYAGASDALALLVVAMMCLSLTVTLTMYLLAVGCRWIVGVLAAGSVAAVVALAAAHGAPRPTARNDLVVQAAVAAATSVVFVVVHRRRLPARLRRHPA